MSRPQRGVKVPNQLWTIVGLAVVACPFVVLLWLLGRTSRNQGMLHGGGWEKYRQLRAGHPDPPVKRRGWRR
jgi:hypothetical protein